MIHTRELRIGNYVSILDRGKIEPHYITTKITQILHNEVKTEYHKYTDSCLCINPVPLTEDILLKCGFEKGHSMDLICDDCFTMPILTPDMLVDVFKNKSENSWYVHIDDEACCSVGYAKDIQYLHEFQNIFCNLTKTELNVQL